MKKEVFLYNPNTDTLHIKGYCHHTKGLCFGWVEFKSEDEALAFDGRAVGMCKLCQRKRERLLGEVTR